MKKILIVNNNMQVGGVQKSLCNLLQALEGKAEITLVLFSRNGAYQDDIPESVHVIECHSLFRYLGMSQGQCKGIHKLIRGVLAAICKTLGRRSVMKLLLASQKLLSEKYDSAIAFLHNGNEKNFYGGVQEFVLYKVRASQKIAFLHGDYGSCGANTPANNAIIRQFNWIAACSDGCRDACVRVLEDMSDRCVTVRNCHAYEQIREMSEEEKIQYPSDGINIVMVSRLAHEKGIERAIEAVANAADMGVHTRLHVIGCGPMEQTLRDEVKRYGMEEAVLFYGEKPNPYPYLRAADLFLMTSFHEAAPMVIEEARCLAVPVLTVRTTSSDEMVTAKGCGWVCENDQKSLNEALLRVLVDKEGLQSCKKRIQSQSLNNAEALAQFMNLIEG